MCIVNGSNLEGKARFYSALRREKTFTNFKVCKLSTKSSVQNWGYRAPKQSVKFVVCWVCISCGLHVKTFSHDSLSLCLWYLCTYLNYSHNILLATKQRFHELLSVHVYSVQKSCLKVWTLSTVITWSLYTLAIVTLKLQDSGLLFAADYDATKEHIGDYSKYFDLIIVPIFTYSVCFVHDECQHCW